MPEGHITVTEAQRIYRISQKTIRKWIRDGVLPAQEEYVNGLRQYAIATSDIEAVMAQKAMIGKIPVDTSTHSTEQRIAALERRVTELEAMVQPVRSAPLPAAKHKQTSDDLPDNLVSYPQFARLHNIGASTVQKAIESGRLQVVRGEWKTARAIVKTALDATGRAEFVELFQGNEHFVRCENCPHQ